MSCSLWRYSEECEGQPCNGDCDLCEIEQDGFITWEINNEVISDSQKVLSEIPSGTVSR